MSDPIRTPDDEVPRDEALGALYRQLPDDEPRAAVDDAIRAAARRAVGDGPRPRAGAWRWRVPLAAAATLLLTLVIVREETVQEAVLQADVPRALPAPEAPPAMQETAPEVVAASEDARASSATPAAGRAAPLPQAMEAARERDVALARAEDARQEKKQDAGNVVAAAPAAAAPAPAAAMVESVTVAATDEATAPVSPQVATGSLAGSAAPAAKAVAPLALAKKEAVADFGWVRWPYGLSLDEPADRACARVTRYRTLAGCTARRDDDGSLVLALTAADAQALTDDLRNRLLGDGWRATGPSTNGDGERYVQSLRGATAKAEWQPAGGGVIELRLFAGGD